MKYAKWNGEEFPGSCLLKKGKIYQIFKNNFNDMNFVLINLREFLNITDEELNNFYKVNKKGERK